MPVPSGKLGANKQPSADHGQRLLSRAFAHLKAFFVSTPFRPWRLRRGRRREQDQERVADSSVRCRAGFLAPLSMPPTTRPKIAAFHDLGSRRVEKARIALSRRATTVVLLPNLFRATSTTVPGSVSSWGLGGQLPHPVFTTGDEYQTHADPGEAPSKGLADPGRGPCHQRPGTVAFKEVLHRCLLAIGRS